MATKKAIEYKINENGCFVCTSHYIDRDGYARMKVGKKPYAIHRFIYESYHGEIPKGLYVLHKCDNPSCINPNHLEIGTHGENMRHKVERGRTGKGIAKKRKLTAEDVLEIRKIGYEIRAEDLAKIYGVHVHSIKNIRAGRTWKKLLEKGNNNEFN